MRSAAKAIQIPRTDFRLLVFDDFEHGLRTHSCKMYAAPPCQISSCGRLPILAQYIWGFVGLTQFPPGLCHRHVIYYLSRLFSIKSILVRGKYDRLSLGVPNSWFEVFTYVYTLSSGLFAQLPREHAFSITVHSNLKILCIW